MCFLPLIVIPEAAKRLSGIHSRRPRRIGGGCDYGFRVRALTARPGMTRQFPARVIAAVMIARVARLDPHIDDGDPAGIDFGDRLFQRRREIGRAW